LKKEGASEEEIQDELNIILTQQAYTQQRRGKETAEIYEKVLKTKPSDLSVQAVCMNNLAVIRKGDKVNSYNKLKQVSSNPSVIEKLSTKQRKSIGFNRSILLILLGKMEESRQLANELQKEFPQSEFLPIVNAAIYHAEKNYNQAANVLKEYIKQNPKGSIEVKLSLAQIYLQQRNMTELNNLLQSNVEQINSSPALLNKLAALYERTGDVESALKFLDESVTKLSKSDENYRQLVKRNADFKMKYKKYRDAAEWYTKILEVNKNDKEALPLAIIATAHYNQDQAEKLETKLPQLAEEHQDIDVERLETIPVISTRRYRAQENQVSKATKKRKRHNKKPKHFDPRIPPNPERWLPRWQRTKGGKRGKKGPQKGPAQGAAHLVKEEERKQAAAQEKLAQPKDGSKNQAPPPGSKNKPVLNVNKKRRRK
jgi:signal recognition particle subunit SRP72